MTKVWLDTENYDLVLFSYKKELVQKKDLGKTNKDKNRYLKLIYWFNLKNLFPMRKLSPGFLNRNEKMVLRGFVFTFFPPGAYRRAVGGAVILDKKRKSMVFVIGCMLFHIFFG